MLELLQLLSGVAWFFPAFYLTGRILRSWRSGASRSTLLAAPIGFVAWMMVGFVIRWIVWPHSIEVMHPAETTTWAALYLMSIGLAIWVLRGAYETRYD